MAALELGIVGQGVVGSRVAALAAARGHRVGWTVDPDPSRVAPLAGVRSATSLAAAAPAGDVAVVATASRLEEVYEAVTALVRAGLDVVSPAEELAFPWRRHPELAAELDQLARRHGVSVLGTGFNPGFMMDLLPATLSALLADVARVELVRTVDMSAYGPLVHRFGLGASPDEFEARRQRDELAGHIGFEESIACLAAALRLELDAIEVARPEIVELADRGRAGKGTSVGPGEVAVVGQRARGRAGARTPIECVARFGIFADPESVGGDRWTLESSAGRRLSVASDVPIESVEATACMVVNTLEAVHAAAPGLLSPTELAGGAIAAPARIS